MSYARFGWEGSDVYVFSSVMGLECCACHLLSAGRGANDEDVFKSEVFDSNEKMIEHLLRHRAAGDHVPEDTFDRLRDPEDALRNQQMWRQYAEDPDSFKSN